MRGGSSTRSETLEDELVSRSESPGGPALSSVIVTPDDYDTIATTVRHLSAQSIAAQLELVIVAPRADRVRVPPNVQASVHSVRIVEIGELKSLAAAKAIGVSVAAAPIVAFNEDHSFPEPGWAEALLGAHRVGYSGVAPQMKNANPATALSWAAMFLHFGGTVEPSGGFEADYPAATHNMSYTRAALSECGDRLADLLVAEMFLHEALRARGHRLWVEPSAATRHVNISRLWSALRHAWIGGRLYGGLRRSFGDWPLRRRIVYAGGSPLIPLVRLRRVVPLMRRTAAGRSALPRALPAITLILIVHAIGEAAGYLVGVGGTAASYSDIETRRDRFVRREERALWA
jgi:hypothetical protein